MQHIDLFSGIGGFALAARWCGLKTVAFCEIDKFCQKVLTKNFPGVPIYDDVRTFPSDKYPRPFLLTGGFPCQPYSVAGLRRGAEDDRALWPTMLEVIKTCRPTWVLGENVAGFVSMGLDQSLSDLEAAGYATQAFIIPACGVNAQHRRDRVWIVAHTAGVGCGEMSKRFVIKGGKPVIAEIIQEKICSNDFIPYTTEQRLSKREMQRSNKNEKLSTTQRDNNAYRGWWQIEPSVGRVANGVPGRVDRLKSLGNAIVPQVAAEIIAAMVETE